jgi:hypothetical protein
MSKGRAGKEETKKESKGGKMALKPQASSLLWSAQNQFARECL